MLKVHTLNGQLLLEQPFKNQVNFNVAYKSLLLIHVFNADAEISKKSCLLLIELKKLIQDFTQPAMVIVVSV